MELLSIPMLISLAAIFMSLPLMFLLWRNKPHSSIASSMLPPGTMGWPIIGENFEFLKEKFVKDRMEKFSSQIFKTSILGESVAVLCGPAGNKCLFSNEDKLVTGWAPPQSDIIFPSSTQSSGNEEGKKLRKLLPGFLKAEALQRYIGIMDSVAKQHLKACWENHKEVYVLPLAKSYTFAIGCRLFVSIDDPVQLAKFEEPFTVLTTSYLSLPINLPGMPFNKAVKASNVLRKYLLEIIKQRKIELAEVKALPARDILSHMLCTSDVNGQFMEEADIADKILGLLVGGHTASAVITFFVKYLAEFPHVYNQVLEEQREVLENKPPGEPLNWEHLQKMRYSWNVACEVMRLASPIQGTFREALTDFTFAGFTIPKGWKLYWSINSTHRDANYFHEPEKFDPTRFQGNGPEPYTYVPFGGGPRMCPGKEYARLEMLVFMHNLVTKFKWEKIDPNENIVFNTAPIPVKGLPILLQPHVC